MVIAICALACCGDGVPDQLPHRVSELRTLLQGKNQREAYKATLEYLGKPARNVGSGFSIEQWDIDGGILTFHQATGPTFRDAAGRTTWLISTRNEVAANVHSGFEMFSLAEHDPARNGTEYWLGNIDLLSSGRYEYRDSGQFSDYKKIFPRHFFADHPAGKFEVAYSEGVKPTDVLEGIPDGTEICKITYVSGGAAKTFGILTSITSRRLSFESDGQVFRMRRGWSEYWPQEITKPNGS